jgi:hypothetical protein
MLSFARSSSLLRRCSKQLSVLSSLRTAVTVGDKVPVNYIKGDNNFLFVRVVLSFVLIFLDEPVPVIKEDSEYPYWLNSIAEKVSCLTCLSVTISLFFVLFFSVLFDSVCFS